MKPNNEPIDILCYRPSSFKDMQKQHESLKKGLDVDKRLEIDDGSKVTVGLTMWVTWMSMMLVNKGMDTVFMVWDGQNDEINLLKTWGQTTLEKVQEWVQRLTQIGDKWDLENLRLSAFAVRNSMGTNLLNRVISFVGAEASGPVLFLSAITQVNFMTAGLVRGLCDSIVQKDLKKIVGENVAKMSQQIMTLIRQIQSSGTEPTDLLFLVSKPYTTGTQETFRTFAQQIYAQIIEGTFKGDHMNIIVKANNFYQNLVQSGDYQPAKSVKKDSDSVLHSLMAKMDSKLNELKMNPEGGLKKKTKSGVKCYNCGKEGHIKPDCPSKKKGEGDQTKRPPLAAWRMVAPKDGEPKSKKVEGSTAKWCAKCGRGKGMWHIGDKAHLEADHKSIQQLRAAGIGSDKVESGKLAVMEEPEEPLQDNEQLEVSFR